MPEEERQYISSEAECRETTITDGFVLIACDGIWDEMDNNQAADICGRLLVKTANDPKANVADLFVEVRRAVSKDPLPSLSPRCRCACGLTDCRRGLLLQECLKQAAKRVSEEFEEEENLTIDALKKRPSVPHAPSDACGHETHRRWIVPQVRQDAGRALAAARRHDGDRDRLRRHVQDAPAGPGTPDGHAALAPADQQHPEACHPG